MAPRAPYVELHAHSAFSFLDGASTPAELAGAAAQLGYPAFALTDHDGVWGSMEFVQACKEIACGDVAIKPITGAEVTVRTSPAGYAHLTLLVQDATGYCNLCRLLTAAHSHTRDSSQRSAGQPSVTLEQVEEHAAGLVCLSGCAGAGMLAAAWERGDAAAGAETARRLLRAFGRDRFRVELQRPFWRRDRSRNRWLAGLAERLGAPTVATGNVHSHTKRRAHLQDAFVATRLGMTLEESEALRRGNSSSALHRRGRWRSASPNIPRPSPRPCGWPSGSSSTSAASSATATRAPRRRVSTASWPSSAARCWLRATRGPGIGSRRSHSWRASWRRSAPSASPASSSSTTTCSCSPARSPPRCAAATRPARSCRPAAAAAPASARSSATSPASPTSIRSPTTSTPAASSTRRSARRPARRCPTSTSTSRATSARC